MQHPIQNRIGAVFVPVSDMQRAIGWYSEFLNVPNGETSHEDKIYDVPMQGDVALILDGHKAVCNSSQPLCFFWTDDIAAAYQHLQEMGVEIVREIEDIGSVLTLVCADPDQNILMVCQRNR